MSDTERVASALRGIVARASRDQQGAGSFDVLAERVLVAIQAAAVAGYGLPAGYSRDDEIQSATVDAALAALTEPSHA